MKRLVSIAASLIIVAIGLPGAATAQQRDAQKNRSNIESSGRENIGTVSPFEFRALPYPYDALEPYIDKETMEIHYDKHHRAYYDNFLKAIKGTALESMSILEIFKQIGNSPAAVRNNSGGYFNHAFYWESMNPKGGGLPSGKLLDAIEKSFGSFDEFKKQFSDAGATRFGSGWAWLCLDATGKLFVYSSPNQDNPLMDIAEKQGTPLLAMDVWEHAYYLKYQNKRADYIEAFWYVIGWDEVAARYSAALE